MKEITPKECVLVADVLNAHAWVCNRNAYDAQDARNSSAAGEHLRKAAECKQLSERFRSLAHKLHEAHAAPTRPVSHAAPTRPVSHAALRAEAHAASEK